MKANRILFLGNSITMHSADAALGWNNNWGMAASALGKDYVHVLTTAIDARTGGTLRADPTDISIVNPDGSIRDGCVNYANDINIYYAFEKGYATYTNAKFQPQIDWNPDIVVLQFGENVDAGSLNSAALKTSLETLLTGLKNASNPNIFITGYILGSNSTIDAIKQQVCAEDPSHRVFVDLSGVSRDLSNLGDYNHPNDKGMALIGDTLFHAMVVHSVPEPSVCVLLITLGVFSFFAYIWRRRSNR
jgi:hypothetical protein